MKEFNTAGTCFPQKHYMVDVKDRLQNMKSMIDKEQYFCINRGRQYGKTTTINALCEYLRNDYAVFSITFEDISSDDFVSLENLLSAVIDKMNDMVIYEEVNNISVQNRDILSHLAARKALSSKDFSIGIMELTKNNGKPVVLIIDEVDQASNYESFLKFLGILRAAYLNRVKRPTFKSVVLSSVYDIKNLKQKIPGSSGSMNSPWNIATSFDMPMEFDAADIAGMLQEYVAERAVDFDVKYISQQIAEYTGGYPYLVSKICQLIDENGFSWDREGLLSAMRKLLKDSNVLFDDLRKKIDDNPLIRNMFNNILYTGQLYTFDINNAVINLAYAFNFIKNNNGKVKIANPIFETMLYNLFLSESETSGKVKSVEGNQFIVNGKLDIELVLEKFSQHYNDIYSEKDVKFLETECRKMFMLYVKPIINGTGNYYIEAETRDGTRTDMIIDYLGEQFVIEMKIWRGDAYQRKGEIQLTEYLDKMHVTKGYLVTFKFNHNKVTGKTEKIIDGKQIIEYVV